MTEFILNNDTITGTFVTSEEIRGIQDQMKMTRL